MLRLYCSPDSPPQWINANQPLTLPGENFPLIASGPAGVNHFLVGVSDSALKHDIFEGQAADKLFFLHGSERDLSAIQNKLISVSDRKAQITWALFDISETEANP